MFQVTKSLVQYNFSNVFDTRNKLNYNVRHALNFDVSQLNSVYRGNERTYAMQNFWSVPQ